MSEKHSILARSVFVLHGHRFCRDIAVVLIASIAIWILVIHCIFIAKLETGDSQDMKYFFSVSSVAEQRFSQFHDVFWWSRWNEEAATLESFDQRVKLFVSSAKEEEILVWSSTSRHV